MHKERKYPTYRYEVNPRADTVIFIHRPEICCHRARGTGLAHRLSGELIVRSLVADLIAGAARREGEVSRRYRLAGRRSGHRRKMARGTERAAGGSVSCRYGSCRANSTRPAACYWRIESGGTNRAHRRPAGGSIAGPTRSASQRVRSFVLSVSSIAGARERPQLEGVAVRRARFASVLRGAVEGGEPASLSVDGGHGGGLAAGPGVRLRRWVPRWMIKRRPCRTERRLPGWDTGRSSSRRLRWSSMRFTRWLERRFP